MDINNSYKGKGGGGAAQYSDKLSCLMGLVKLIKSVDCVWFEAEFLLHGIGGGWICTIIAFLDWFELLPGLGLLLNWNFLQVN